MEDTKNIKDDKKEKESPELKEELTEEEVKSVDGGVSTPTGEQAVETTFFRLQWADSEKPPLASTTEVRHHI